MSGSTPLADPHSRFPTGSSCSVQSSPSSGSRNVTLRLAFKLIAPALCVRHLFTSTTRTRTHLPGYPGQSCRSYGFARFTTCSSFFASFAKGTMSRPERCTASQPTVCNWISARIPRASQPFLFLHIAVNLPAFFRRQSTFRSFVGHSRIPEKRAGEDMGCKILKLHPKAEVCYVARNDGFNDI